jgi:type III secretion system low calcium response chaperone LcrH/SycD
MKGSRGTKGQMKKENTKLADNLLKEEMEAHGINLESFGVLEKGAQGFLKKVITDGMTPKDAIGVKPSVLEGIYAQAYRLYNTGKYIEAVHIFRILILMNPMEAKYLLGLAACFHMLKEYKNAIQSYTMCSLMDPKSPIPHYHSSDCFIQMKDYLSAMVCLQMSIDIAGQQPQYAKIKERAQLSLDSLKQQDLPSTPTQMSEEDFTLMP